MGGRLPSERVAALRRNQWPLWLGLRSLAWFRPAAPPIVHTSGTGTASVAMDTEQLGRFTPRNSPAKAPAIISSAKVEDGMGGKHQLARGNSRRPHFAASAGSLRFEWPRGMAA
jgi:hypothetical protein